MKAIIFLSTDDLIEQLMTMDSPIGGLSPQTGKRDVDDDEQYYRGIYSETMEKIKKYHRDYPYLERTKKFGCWMI
jgi:hypothetical protein